MFRVVKDFISKDDLKQYKAGEEITRLDASRAEHLISRGYISEVEAEAAHEEAEAEPEPEKKPQKAKAASKGKKKA